MKKRTNEVALGGQKAGAGAISRDGNGANQANAAPKTAKRKKKAKKNAGDNAGAQGKSGGVEGTGSASDDAYSDSSTTSNASGNRKNRKKGKKNDLDSSQTSYVIAPKDANKRARNSSYLEALNAMEEASNDGSVFTLKSDDTAKVNMRAMQSIHAVTDMRNKEANANPKNAKRKKKAKGNAGAKEKSDGVEETGSVSNSDAPSDSSTNSNASAKNKNHKKGRKKDRDCNGILPLVYSTVPCNGILGSWITYGSYTL